MRKVLVFWLVFVGVATADVWVVTPSEYYVMSLTSEGTPVLTPAPNIDGFHVLGKPPIDPDKPVEDKWGLVAFSEAAAKKVVDPKRNETAAKLSGVYPKLGKLVQKGTVTKKKLRAVWDVLFDQATGSSKEHWAPWKEATDAKYHDKDLQGAEDAGQGIIDLGLGVGRTSNASIGDWVEWFWEWFVEFILPGLLNPTEASV